MGAFASVAELRSGWSRAATRLKSILDGVDPVPCPPDSWHRSLPPRTKFADHVDVTGAVNVSAGDDAETYGANDMSDLKIFISHKMPKDGVAASLIGQFIASNSGSKIDCALSRTTCITQPGIGTVIQYELRLL
jgi:hypothetical protein